MVGTGVAASHGILIKVGGNRMRTTIGAHNAEREWRVA